MNAPINVRELRHRLGKRGVPITQYELAERLGVNQATISRIESGERTPKGPLATVLNQMSRKADQNRRRKKKESSVNGNGTAAGA